MKEEILKQLQGTGFPIIVYSKYGTNYQKITADFVTFDGSDFWKLPTLSELIEGCNPVKADEFGVMTDTTRNWTAFYSYHGYFEHNEKFLQSDGLYELSLNVYGDTPEESVASLWLALN